MAALGHKTELERYGRSISASDPKEPRGGTVPARTILQPCVHFPFGSPLSLGDNSLAALSWKSGQFHPVRWNSSYPSALHFDGMRVGQSRSAHDRHSSRQSLVLLVKFICSNEL